MGLWRVTFNPERMTCTRANQRDESEIGRTEGSDMEGSKKPIFITIKDAASMLGLSEDTLHHLKAGTHRLTRVRFGRSVRLIRQEVEDHIDQRIKASRRRLDHQFTKGE